MAKNINKKRGSKDEKVFYKTTPKAQRKRNESFGWKKDAQGNVKRKKPKRNRENELIWIYKQGQGNFWFVDMIDEKTWEKLGYFVHELKKLDAFEGDEVAFELQYFKWKAEAVIKKVLKRSEHLIVGTLKIGKTYAFVITENPLVKNDIFIPGKHIGGYADGSRVAVQILKWEGKNPEGRIIESLEALPEGREDIYKIAFEMGARRSFGDSVKQEVKKLSKKLDESALSGRKDYRKLLTYTIDGAESKDLDDAISIEKLSSGYRLYVHIADVTHYVTENTALDREARKRGTSIYLCDQVIPMLPAELSNGLCSLHPGEDKLTLTCEIEVDTSGKIVETAVYESVIHSDFRLTYREIDEMLSGKLHTGEELQFGNIFSVELYENITTLSELKDILSKYKYAKWVLDFDFPETKVVLDAAGKPVEYKRYERYNSYKIIEECMVLANEAVSRMFTKYPFLYRVHELPDEEDVEKFGKIIASVDTSITLPKPQSIKPKHFQQILELLKKSPRLEYFQKLLLRSLSKARYSEKNFGHFGLALDFYSHFTSPIRRYPDLQIHRIMKEIVSKTYGNERKKHYEEILPKIARRSSETAERAEKMEYKVRDMMACKFMADKVGERFTGKISGMIEKGFFVELENTIEGFIEFWFTGFQFESETFTIMESHTWKQLHFWDEVQVKLSHIDEQRMRLEFEIVSVV